MTSRHIANTHNTIRSGEGQQSIVLLQPSVFKILAEKVMKQLCNAKPAGSFTGLDSKCGFLAKIP